MLVVVAVLSVVRRADDPRPAAAGRPGHRARPERRGPRLPRLGDRRAGRGVVDHLGLSALPAAAHRHRRRLLEPPPAHRAHPASADQRVRRPPHRRPRLARRHRHDAPVCGADAGAGGCRRQRSRCSSARSSPWPFIDPVLLASIVVVIGLSVVGVTLLSGRIRKATQEQQEKVGELASSVERAVGSIRTVRASGATERESAAITGIATDVYGVGVRIAKVSALIVPDRRHRAAGVAARRARARRLPRRLGCDLGREPRDLRDVPVPADRPARLVLRRDHLGQPGARRARAASRRSSTCPPRAPRTRRSRAASDRPSDRRGRQDRAPDADDARDRVPRRPLPLPRGRRRGAPQGGVRGARRARERARRHRRRSTCRMLRQRAADAATAGRGDVLRGVSFSVPRGARVALVGPSGAGKSTTLALIERFYDPTDGAILVGGRGRPHARPRRPARAARLCRAGCADARRDDRRQPPSRLARRHPMRTASACCAR